MDKQEHAAALARAVGASGLSRKEIADVVGRGVRTVSNWTSETSPTMPTEHEKTLLRRLLGPYDAAGDPVELAIRSSPLVTFRQTKVIGYYQEQLHEQRLQEGRSA